MDRGGGGDRVEEDEGICDGSYLNGHLQHSPADVSIP